jgi:hypothetical protein
MLKKDPNDRFTMDQVKASAWMNRAMVTPEDIKDDFYRVKSTANEDYLSNYEANKEAKRKFSANDQVNRGPSALSE